jgi:nitroreductase
MRYLSTALFIVALIASYQPNAYAQDKQRDQAATTSVGRLETIKLDAPDLNKGIPMMQAFKNRKSERALADKKLSPQHLSELLWAADGVNREDGHRTAPSAKATYFVDIYVVLEEGVYLYGPAQHQLSPVAEGDFRKQTGGQDFVLAAPVNLVYVADYDRVGATPPAPSSPGNDERFRWACVEAGCQAENVSLYCASEGLGATVRTSKDAEQFRDAVKLRPAQTIIAAQTVGYPKQTASN